MKINVTIQVIEKIKNNVRYDAYMYDDGYGEVYLYNRQNIDDIIENIDDSYVEVLYNNKTANVLYQHGGLMISMDDKKRLLLKFK